jgi:hypothetical protein
MYDIDEVRLAPVAPLKLWEKLSPMLIGRAEKGTPEAYRDALFKIESRSSCAKVAATFLGLIANSVDAKYWA